MRKEIRTFIAIKINAEPKVLDLLAALKRDFAKERIAWVNPDNFHLTLRFVGNTTREQLYDLVDGLEELAPKHHHFRFNVHGTGYFKFKGMPSTLFLKIAENQALQNLASDIENQVVACGFQAEHKTFRPHLTLGRIKHLHNNARFLAYANALPQSDFQEVAVGDIILYQSILKQEGPEYREIRRFDLR